jgi:hypothetical protein
LVFPEADRTEVVLFSKEVRDGYPEGGCETMQGGHGGRVLAALDQADRVHGQAAPPRKRAQREAELFSQRSDTFTDIRFRISRVALVH